MNTLLSAVLCLTMILGLGVFAVEAKTKATGNIVETAISAGSFKTLTAALEAAGLTEVLKGKGKFTVFAPTDEAFAKLPAGTVENLLKPENKDKLIAILKFHVIEGNVKSKTVAKLDGRLLKTLQGGLLKVDATNGVAINGAKVVKADVKATNGVIHVIDTVLIPE